MAEVLESLVGRIVSAQEVERGAAVEEEEEEEAVHSLAQFVCGVGVWRSSTTTGRVRGQGQKRKRRRQASSSLAASPTAASLLGRGWSDQRLMKWPGWSDVDDQMWMASWRHAQQQSNDSMAAAAAAGTDVGAAAAAAAGTRVACCYLPTPLFAPGCTNSTAEEEGQEAGPTGVGISSRKKKKRRVVPKGTAYRKQDKILDVISLGVVGPL